jgi:hypothetical protein
MYGGGCMAGCCCCSTLQLHAMGSLGALLVDVYSYTYNCRYGTARVLESTRDPYSSTMYGTSSYNMFMTITDLINYYLSGTCTALCDSTTGYSRTTVLQL